MKKGIGSCPATCGELVQGYMDKNEYISSYCIDLYSNAVVSESRSENKKTKSKKSKAFRAVELVFEYFDIDTKELDNISLFIKSNIPIGKGMASSTADIGASIMATLDFLGKSMTEVEISKLVSEIEPTDSIFFSKVCIFNPIEGKNLKELGLLPYEKVIVLEPFKRINTLKLRGNKDYYKKLSENRAITSNSFKLLENGIKNNDGDMIRRACENSAIANENIKQTPYLKEILEISKKYGACFINISHTGTVVGIVVDENTDVDNILSTIRKTEISDFYKKQYVRNIIEGGLRKGWSK